MFRKGTETLIAVLLLSLASFAAHAASLTLVCYNAGGNPVALPVTACALPQWHNVGGAQPVSSQAGWIAYSTALTTPILTCNMTPLPAPGAAQSVCPLANQVYVAPAGGAVIVTPSPTTYTATITWTNPTLDILGGPVGALVNNKLYRGTSPTTLVLVKTITPPATSYADVGLLAGTYYYAVTATNASQESDQSNVMSETFTAVVTLGAPSSPVITSVK